MESVLSSVGTCRCAAGLGPVTPEPDQRRAEVLGWHEIHSLVDGLTPEERLKPGYYPEGWTVRDLMAHLGAWLAEGGIQLEQIGAGTYQEGELDVEAANQRFFEATRGVPFDIVYVQAWASRWRMLGVWRDLTDTSYAAARWLSKVGPQHYDDHLPGLREWSAELTGQRAEMA
jgi:hypothetical protein